ncbi:MAG: sulfatase-like hydrolase/transferase [Spirochaetaceae bacterium]
MKKPNIIYIYTDQQSASMMSCAGNNFLKTPAMDYLAAGGTRFTRAYSPNPVCAPARVSMMTGQFPGVFNDSSGNQVRENDGAMSIAGIPSNIMENTLGSIMGKSGYDLYYGGKEHLPVELKPENQGFTKFTSDERDNLADKAADIISNRSDNPYCMIVSLINPHDICYMAIRDFGGPEEKRTILEGANVELDTLDKALKVPSGISEEEFFNSLCPPIPNNFEPQENEPLAIKSLIESRPFRKNARDKYSKKEWRMHRWAYCRLTEMVDTQIEIILNAVKSSGSEEDTIIIFSSDHGDNDSSHKLEHKTVLYEESVNIPFTVMWKGHIPAGNVDSTHLISNGLDIVPTICDYAGIEVKADPRGASLRPLLENSDQNETVKWRSTLGVESEIGRMVIRSDGLKYIRYDSQGMEEQLLDLKVDPGETKDFFTQSTYQIKLNEMRQSFENDWFTGF